MLTYFGERLQLSGALNIVIRHKCFFTKQLILKKNQDKMRKLFVVIFLVLECEGDVILRYVEADLHVETTAFAGFDENESRC